MRITYPSRLAGSIARPLAVVLVALPLWATAQSGPSIAGPSMVRASQVAVFVGRGFTANGALSVSITAPGGAETVYGTVAGADGTLSHPVAPRAAGAHTLKVLDPAGKVLAKVTFIAME